MPEGRPAGSRNLMEFGWRVPSYAGPQTTARSARALVPYFAKVEEAGFDGLWVIDHLLVAPNVYSVAWQDPMITLAVAAGATERIRLGTAILCAPFRHPTIIAKEVASLDNLSGGGRVILGIGTGHDDMEFASVGVPRRERGRRTDEALELIRLLLSTDDLSYRGTYYSVAGGTTLYPRPAAPIPHLDRWRLPGPRGRQCGHAQHGTGSTRPHRSPRRLDLPLERHQSRDRRERHRLGARLPRR